MPNARIGFIGAGRMATALARGLISGSLAASEDICAFDPMPVAVSAFQQATGGRALECNRRVAESADIVILAVKPQQIDAVLAELRGHLTDKHLVISVAAGVPLRKLADGLGSGPRLARVMPNTPCLLGAGASAYCLGASATPDDAYAIERLLSAVGIVRRVDEKLMDAVTGLSGSGPAFVCVLIEALADGGVRVGLPRDAALQLAAQTVYGTARMVLETGDHPAALKDQVASPGGTTIAGLAELEARGFRGAVIAAVKAATRRSEELGRSTG